MTAAFSCPAAFAQDCFAEFPGGRVYYQDVGQGPLSVVFIHGWSCDHTFWQGQIPEISKKYRVIALDMPGHGRSDKPHVSYTQDFLVQGVNAVLQKAKVQKRRAGRTQHGGVRGLARGPQKPLPGQGPWCWVDGAFLDVPRETKAQIDAFLKPFQGPDYRGTVVKFVEAMLGPAITPQLKK